MLLRSYRNSFRAAFIPDIARRRAGTLTRRARPASIGLSGAGFLACYHLGVVKALMDHGMLVLPSTHATTGTNDTNPKAPMSMTGADSPVWIGVSAGSLVAASFVAGIDPVIGLEAVLDVARTTRRVTGRYTGDALQLGFSLVDVVEHVFGALLCEHVGTPVSNARFLDRANATLRIGLTDRRVFPPIGYNPSATLVVDTFRSVEDVVAACLLSSYVPGVTGPALGRFDPVHTAVARSSQVVDGMMQAGCIKHGVTREPVQWVDETNGIHSDSGPMSQREFCWDGGLVNAFPSIDHTTLMVSPIAATFHWNKASISPAIAYSTTPSTLQVSPKVSVHLTTANAWAFSSMILSSDEASLRHTYQQGYDNATLYLERQEHFLAQLYGNAQNGAG